MINKSEHLSSSHYWIDFSALYQKADAISQAYNSNNLVFFLGSGVSKTYAPEMPNWEELLDVLLTKLRPANPSQRAEVQELIDHQRYLLAAKAIKQYAVSGIEDRDTTIHSAIAEILRQRFKKSVKKNPILHLTLFDFSVPIFTTNYDTILEHVISEYGIETLNLPPLSRPRHGQNKRNSYAVIGQERPVGCTSGKVLSLQC